MATIKQKSKEFVMTPGYGGRIAGDLEFRAMRMDWEGHISLLIRHDSPGPIRERPISVATSITFERVDPDNAHLGNLEVDPTLKLRFDEAQQLMDQLWEVGCRPSDAVGSKGQLAATQQHLADMRAIIASALDVNFGVVMRENR